jgi:hypothetical protein
MQSNSHPGSKVAQAVVVFLLLFTCAWSLSARSKVPAGPYRLDETSRKSIQVPALTPGVEQQLAVIAPLKITRAVMNFGDDHSLAVTTSVEQNISGIVHYSVQLQLDSGAPEFFVVAAPSGGLQVELQDMTGDNVANDLLLRPAFLDQLPTVLVNDGQDHFTVAISAGDPASISCRQSMDSGGSESRGTIGLMSSGFRAGGLRHDDELFPQLREISFASVSQFFARESEQSSSSGRAPPLREI